MNINKDSVLGFSIIDNRLKIFVKQGIVSQSQNTNQQSDNTPDINNREGEIAYYETFSQKNGIVESEKANSPTDDRAFFQVWKQGDKYYGKVNPSNLYHKALIERPDGSLKPFFEYIENNSATKIKNIKPAIFDLSTKKLIKKGEIELL